MSSKLQMLKKEKSWENKYDSFAYSVLSNKGILD